MRKSKKKFDAYSRMKFKQTRKKYLMIKFKTKNWIKNRFGKKSGNFDLNFSAQFFYITRWMNDRFKWDIMKIDSDFALKYTNVGKAWA